MSARHSTTWAWAIAGGAIALFLSFHFWPALSVGVVAAAIALDGRTA